MAKRLPVLGLLVCLASVASPLLARDARSQFISRMRQVTGVSAEGDARPKALAACEFQSISIGQTLGGQWDSLDCDSGSPDHFIFDFWVFQGNAGQQVTATVTFTDFGLSPVLLAFQDFTSGEVLASDFGASPVDVSYTLPRSGQWVIGLASSDSFGYGTYSLRLSAGGGGGGPACTPTSTSLCLNNQRFRVTTDWRKPDGSTGQGSAVALTADTGYFWFFSAANVEAIVKVLDACSFSSRHWVFAGGLTNVEVTLRVTDTQTGAMKTYTNPLGVAFQPIQDTSAFTCP